MTSKNESVAIAPAPILSKSAMLRQTLVEPELDFLMEAHDGISAKIVEEAGFRGIWASGLAISAALGVRDSNEASWTQVLETLEFMADASNIPILVDGDTGYGNFNNMRRAVVKLCQRGIAGICIEDKLFPKTNSFIGEGQPLADIDEFCGKIRAGKDSQTDEDFCVVARVEALIAGRGMDEALRRAEAYHQAGADAILIHSKKRDADEILTFLHEWDNRGPVVIVPTTYHNTPTDHFRKAGVSTIIWANHNIRASISAMRDVSAQIYRDQSLVGIEGQVASVADIFALAGNDELADAEKRYLPTKQGIGKAVILAASRGSELGALTADRPKCMIDIGSQPLLRRLVSAFNDGGVHDLTVVRGYAKEKVNLPSINMVDNDDFATTGEAATLACAAGQLNGGCYVAYGDILFRQHILDQVSEVSQVSEVEADITLAVDALWDVRDADPRSRVRDLVSCSQPFNPGYLNDDVVSLKDIGPDMEHDHIHGEWIGLARLSARGAELVEAELSRMGNDNSLNSASMIDLFSNLLRAGHDIHVVYVAGQWLDVDNHADLAEARKFL